jgi:hypothetical protein
LSTRKGIAESAPDGERGDDGESGGADEDEDEVEEGGMAAGERVRERECGELCSALPQSISRRVRPFGYLEERNSHAGESPPPFLRQIHDRSFCRCSAIRRLATSRCAYLGESLSRSS